MITGLVIITIVNYGSHDITAIVIVIIIIIFIIIIIIII